MELTADEKRRIYRAWGYDGSAIENARGSLADARNIADEVEKLGTLWAQTSEAARAAIEVKLALLASPDAEAGTPSAIDPRLLDISAALKSIREDARDDSLNKLRSPGFQAACWEAAQIWYDRGNVGGLGNPHRDTNPHSPSPLLQFVMYAVTEALPANAVASATPGKSATHEQFMVAVHTQLRGVAAKLAKP